MGKEITHECSNLRKIILLRKIPSSSESASFARLLKSLLALWDFEETRQTWPMFSELKALVDSERFRVIVVFSIGQKTITRNFHFQAWFHVSQKIPSYRFCAYGQKRSLWTRNSPENELRDFRVFREFRVIAMALKCDEIKSVLSQTWWTCKGKLAIITTKFAICL